MRRCITLTPVVLFILSSCSPAAPAGLSDADKTALEAHSQSFGKMAVAGDYGALVKAYYTADAILLAPNMPIANGPAAIEKLLHTFPPVTSLSLHTEEVVSAGDMAWGRGTYAMTMAPPGAAVVADSGKWMEVYQKQADGTWKTTRDMFNSNLAPEAPAAAPKKSAGKK